jgi:nucleotide-binding universal stress UspA family protein
MFKIIVPTDFTATADKAIAYAIALKKTLEADVYVLHILKKGGSETDAQKQMDEQIHRHYVNTAVKAKSILKVGSIFDDIPALVEEEKGDLVVMGTHGMKGLQHLVGSHALRVITDTKAPFIVVQDNTVIESRVKKILVPLDLHKETKQKIKYTADIAEKFKSKVEIIIPNETDEFLRNQLERNMAYSEGYFEERGIPYQTVVAEGKSSAFADQVIEQARIGKSDMICILNFANEKLIHAFGSDAEQKVITNNAAIPVMVLNPAITNLHNTRSLIAQWG